MNLQVTTTSFLTPQWIKCYCQLNDATNELLPFPLNRPSAGHGLASTKNHISPERFSMSSTRQVQMSAPSHLLLCLSRIKKL